MRKKYKRSLKTLREDCILPSTLRSISDVEYDKRLLATVEVLRLLPENWYKKLLMKIDSFSWFLPHALNMGGVEMFSSNTPPRIICNLKTKPSSKVLYLSPMLEAEKIGVSICTIAHEIAHIVLNHDVYTKGDQYSKQEEEAWKLAKKWVTKTDHRVYKEFDRKRR